MTRHLGQMLAIFFPQKIFRDSHFTTSPEGRGAGPVKRGRARAYMGRCAPCYSGSQLTSLLWGVLLEDFLFKCQAKQPPSLNCRKTTLLSVSIAWVCPGPSVVAEWVWYLSQTCLPPRKAVQRMTNELSFPASHHIYIFLTAFLSKESGLLFDEDSIHEIDKYLGTISICQHQFAVIACVLNCSSCVWLFTTQMPWTVAYQALLSMGFPRQQYCSGFAIPFSRWSSWPRVWTWVSCIAGRFFTHWATWELSFNYKIQMRLDLVAYLISVFPARLWIPCHQNNHNPSVLKYYIYFFNFLCHNGV